MQQETFNEFIQVMIEKLTKENALLKLENKILRELILKNELEIPNGEIVNQM